MHPKSRLWMRSVALAAAHANMLVRRGLLPPSMWRVLRSRGASDLTGFLYACPGRPSGFVNNNGCLRFWPGQPFAILPDFTEKQFSNGQSDELQTGQPPCGAIDLPPFGGDDILLRKRLPCLQRRSTGRRLRRFFQCFLHAFDTRLAPCCQTRDA